MIRISPAAVAGGQQLSFRPTLVSLEQRTLGGVLNDIVTLGRAVDVADRACTFVEALTSIDDRSRFP